MAELKPGWKRVKFGDVVRQVKDKVDPHSSGLKRYVAGEHMDTDDLRIRRWGGGVAATPPTNKQPVGRVTRGNSNTGALVVMGPGVVL